MSGFTALTSSIVQVINEKGHVRGGACLIDDSTLVTCAKVVSDDIFNKDMLNINVYIRFISDNSRHLYLGSVIKWAPNENLAFIHVESPPTNTTTLPFLRADDLWGHKFRTFGFPKHGPQGIYAQGELLAEDPQNGLLQLDTTRYSIQQGFGGSPVWDAEYEGFVGLIAYITTSDDIDIYYLIPTSQIQDIWSKLPIVQKGGFWMHVAPMWGKPPNSEHYKADVFMMMPFNESFKPIYDDHIVPTVESLNISIKRGDNFFTQYSIMTDVWSAINSCRLCIADCTEKNANVFYELGIAHTLGKDTIIISQTIDDIPFDIRHLRVIIYEYTPRGMREFEQKLRMALQSILS